MYAVDNFTKIWDTQNMFRRIGISVYSYWAIAMAFCVCAVTLFVFLLQQSARVQQLSSLPYDAMQIVTLVNHERQKTGLQPLTLNFQLLDASESKVSDMSRQSYFSHVSPQQQRWSQFITTAKYKYKEAGENLANGFQTPHEIVSAWLRSPSHRENILTPQYTDTGVAITRGELDSQPTIFVVQMFGNT